MKKLTSLLLALIMLFTALTLSGCGIFYQGIECGFYYRDIRSDFFCAYNTDKREFNIDDVTLTFYYGGNYKLSNDGKYYATEELGTTCPNFELHFVNENGDRYLIRNIEEDFYSEKYMVTFNDLLCPIPITKVTFQYSEDITIPSELFVSDSGYIRFCVGTQYPQNPNYFPSNGHNYEFTSIYVLYEKKGNTIILSKDRSVYI